MAGSNSAGQDGSRAAGAQPDQASVLAAGIQGVPTAVPIFIGYTEFAAQPTSGDAAYGTAVQVSSLAEFEACFGGAPQFQVVVAPLASGSDATPAFTAPYPAGDGTLVSTGFAVTQAPGQPAFSLYYQVAMFYANGGGNCYVVSVASYWTGELPTAAPACPTLATGTIAAADLLSGIAAAGQCVGPSIVVVPEACTLDQADYASIVQALLRQADLLRDRMVLIDLPGCLGADSHDALTAAQQNLRSALPPGTLGLEFGAAYAPALNATIASASASLATLVAPAPEGNSVVNTLLTVQAQQTFATMPALLDGAQDTIAQAFPLPAGTPDSPTQSGDPGGNPGPYAGQSPAQWQQFLTEKLSNALPLLGQILGLASALRTPLAPCGAIAGAWATNDRERAVWHTPDNMALTAVASPLYALTQAEQDAFLALRNGAAVNVLRSFAGTGTRIMGAFTTGTPVPFISLRRSKTYVNQSIRQLAAANASLPNQEQAWQHVAAVIESFLTDLWKRGGLQGDSQASAFHVQCRSGSSVPGAQSNDMQVEARYWTPNPPALCELKFLQAMGQG